MKCFFLVKKWDIKFNIYELSVFVKMLNIVQLILENRNNVLKN